MVHVQFASVLVMYAIFINAHGSPTSPWMSIVLKIKPFLQLLQHLEPHLSFIKLIGFRSICSIKTMRYDKC